MRTPEEILEMIDDTFDLSELDCDQCEIPCEILGEDKITQEMCNEEWLKWIEGIEQ